MILDSVTALDGNAPWPSARNFWSAIAPVAADLGTPLYVYSPDAARQAYTMLRESLTAWGPSVLAYSVKTNPFFRLLEDLSTWGAYAEVVSAWEFELALRAGFPPEQIVFNGPLKTRAALSEAFVRPPFTVNIDSLEELRMVQDVVGHLRRPVRVGVRVCPPNPEGEPRSRFGLEIDSGEVGEAIGQIRATPDLVLASIHFHLGTQVKGIDRPISAVRQARQLWLDHSLSSETYLDLGGGFPFEHDRPLSSQSFHPGVFFSSLRSVWELDVRPPLIIEPGRFIAAPAFALVSRVLSCKSRRNEPWIVVLDTGTNHNVMGAFYDHMWSLTEVEREESEFRFCGSLCMEDDILSGPLTGHRPRQDSLVGMLNAGAYSFALARTFIQPRPPIVRLQRDMSVEVLTPRERAEGAYGLWPSVTSDSTVSPSGGGASGSR